jgi:hypothetical protein
LAEGIQFNLKTSDGLFSIHVEKKRLCPSKLQKADELYVLGQPRTYYHQRNRAHQVVIDAVFIIPVSLFSNRTFLYSLPYIVLEFVLRFAQKITASQQPRSLGSSHLIGEEVEG